MKTIVLLGALDTKGREVAYVKARLQERGYRTLVVDNGVMGTPAIPADVDRRAVAAAGGKSLEVLIEESRRTSDRAPVIEVMAEGAKHTVRELLARGQLDAIFSLGGSMGTTMGMRAMWALPVGIPKLMVSTHLYPQSVGDGDVVLMISPADIMGLNPITEGTLSRAAAALAAMLETPAPPKVRRLVGITALGVTTPGAMALQHAMAAQGYDTVVFHGRVAAVDQFAAAGVLDGIIDFTPTQCVRSVMTGPRGEEHAVHVGAGMAAAVPQLFVPGGIDMLVLRVAADQLPEQYRGRRIYRHGPFITAVRTSREDLAGVAAAISTAAMQSKAPSAVVIPTRGFSEIDKEGRAFFDPEADRTFSQELRRRLKGAPIIELEYHVNDGQFAAEVARIFAQLDTAPSRR